MTIIIQQKNQKQKILIAVFAIVFLATIFVIWQGFFKKQEAVTEQISITNRNSEIKIDFSILDHPFLKTSQPFLNIQPFQTSTSSDATSTSQTLGRENPFLPLK